MLKTMTMTRTELGDYQTPLDFAKQVVSLLIRKYKLDPTAIFEPTMGEGHFISASVSLFPNVKKIFGLDINEDYINGFEKPSNIEPNNVHLFCQSIFAFDYSEITKHLEPNENFLCIGNPPWVTNSALSSTDSINLPKKENLQHSRGFDAITGKSNFDIAEYILLDLFKNFTHSLPATYAFLCKGIVARNIFKNAEKHGLFFDVFDLYHFDAKTIFNVSCDAVLLVCKTAPAPNPVSFGSEFAFDDSDRLIKKFGWIGDSFVSNVESYETSKYIVGSSQIEWRQGIKHDCSKVMELQIEDGHFSNGYGEDVTFLKDDPNVYPLVKSSSLKGGIVSTYCKALIVTQKKVGDDTSVLQKDKRLWEYLEKHQEDFAARKSIIYKKSPKYAIFGVGDYSFNEYKIALSGFYKTPRFTLLYDDGRPVMSDDTCYFIGTNNETLGFILYCALDSDVSYRFIASLSFSDSKRPFTKEVLQKIDLLKLIEEVGKGQIINRLKTEFKKTVSNATFDKSLEDLGFALC